ncbi:fatty acid desaturase [Microbulbifer sp. A4B17]|uniref:acyl-CoA desaturase n=1 Tax=Microbulbifer sp. A4B17 TaxID=359370 RepID=UPI001EDDAD4E|nr:fatty acid desaturase [Microbulbifer sp. A4B17]
MTATSQSSCNQRKRFWIPTILFASTGLLALTTMPLYGIVYGYHWYQWLAFALFGALCSFSVAAGNHRLWSHKSYEPHWLLRLLFILFSAAAMQNTTLNWCASHRHHHQFIDDNDRDPYSAGRGFWLSHIDWTMREYSSSYPDYKNVKDLQRDKLIMWQHNNYAPIIIAMNLGIPIILGITTGDILGMMLLAGVLRLVVNHYTTFMINSFGHMWGRRPYKGAISARDNSFLNLFVFGEGYHNYHHIFQIDYRSGIYWFQYDPTKWLIKTLSFAGLTRNLKVAPCVQIKKAKLDQFFKRAKENIEKAKEKENWQKILDGEAHAFASALSCWKSLQFTRNGVKHGPPPANGNSQ